MVALKRSIAVNGRPAVQSACVKARFSGALILPQAIHVMISFINQTIMQVKNTSLVSVIAVADLLYQGQVVTAASYRPLEVYTTVQRCTSLSCCP